MVLVGARSPRFGRGRAYQGDEVQRHMWSHLSDDLHVHLTSPSLCSFEACVVVARVQKRPLYCRKARVRVRIVANFLANARPSFSELNGIPIDRPARFLREMTTVRVRKARDQSDEDFRVVFFRLCEVLQIGALPSVEEFDLCNANVTDWNLLVLHDLLVSPCGMRPCRFFNFANNRVTPDGIRRVSNLLFSSTAFRSLETLDLSNSCVDSSSMRVVSSALEKGCKSLRDLILSHNPIGDEGTLALVDSVRLRGALPLLEHVNVVSCSVGGVGTLALLSCYLDSSFPNLCLMMIGLNDFTISLPSRFLEPNNVAHPHLLSVQEGRCSMLQTVNVGGSKLGDSGADLLFRNLPSLAFPVLRRFLLNDNVLTSFAMMLLGEALLRGAFPFLSCLQIDANLIGDHGMASLSRAAREGACNHLESIRLNDNIASLELVHDLVLATCTSQSPFRNLTHVHVEETFSSSRCFQQIADDFGVVFTG